MAQMRVRFDGLNAFVPVNEEWVAALPDLVKTFRGFEPVHFGLKSDQPAPVLAPHVPALIVADEAVDDLWSERTPQLRFQRAGSDRLYRLYLLSRERLRVSDGRTGSPKADLDLVAPMTKLIGKKPGAGTFDKRLVDGENRPVEIDGRVVDLVATVVIDHGSLAGGQRAKASDTGEVILYEFKPESHEQHQADFVYWTREADDDRLTLTFGSTMGGERVLSLRPRGGQHAYEIDVVNLELEAILGLGRTLRQPRDHDLDFAIFYALSSEWADLKVHLPLPHVLEGAIGGGGGEFCKPSKFSKVSG